MNYLATNSAITILGLRKSMTDAKLMALTFYKTDSHWKAFGAFVGSEWIILILSNR